MALTLTQFGVIQPPFVVPASAGTGTPAQRIRAWRALYQIIATLPLADRLAIEALAMASYCFAQGGTDYRTNISGLINDAQQVTDQGSIHDDTVGLAAQFWNAGKTFDGTLSSDIPTLLNTARALRVLPENQIRRIVLYLRLNCGF